MKKVSDPPDDPFAATLRERSGKFETNDHVIAFLYILMRDHVTPGTVEYMMIQLEKEMWHIDPRVLMELTNGYLAKYAKDVADRLYGIIPLHKKPVAPQDVVRETYLTLPMLEDE